MKILKRCFPPSPPPTLSTKPPRHPCTELPHCTALMQCNEQPFRPPQHCTSAVLPTLPGRHVKAWDSLPQQYMVPPAVRPQAETKPADSDTKVWPPLTKTGVVEFDPAALLPS